MFAYPWIMALGGVAAAAPVVVHWLTRPRPVRAPLSTIRFVRDAVRQQRSRHRLRDFLILAARTLAILLLAAAFAGPRWSRPPLVSDEQAGRTPVLGLKRSRIGSSEAPSARSLFRCFGTPLHRTDFRAQRINRPWCRTSGMTIAAGRVHVSGHIERLESLGMQPIR